mmetsp:Transcript_15338/g.30174  ORF Transcript_15338/g.30174 Transcript_15338/m.30174 type:complete len:777 (+) Transcript_15338:20-2350(+)|eukprot:CAMPEP_0172824246 /NCGR_PEP_ID=MMETSP1075-20121228/17880_1 /TAXON_ID=2916 /ORGANISM="Ceratium fusus, Strain PA161109" /LENGTH=776 /DNA_ID=CAMNT_0013665499 /DNA_START=20 /DNA_END=2350 /DNA_ORIENTATION=-
MHKAMDGGVWGSSPSGFPQSDMMEEPGSSSRSSSISSGYQSNDHISAGVGQAATKTWASSNKHHGRSVNRSGFRNGVLRKWRTGSSGLWKAKVVDRLHEAQVALLQQAEDRQATYCVKPANIQQQTKDRNKLKTSSSSKEEYQSIETSWHRMVSDADHVCRAASCPDMPFRKSTPARLKGELSRKISDRQTVDRKRSQAYMGIDWYRVIQRRKSISWLFIVENLYYYCYMAYIIFAIHVGALAIYLLEPNSRFNFSESIFTSAACVTQAGLAVTDWSDQATSTYIISFMLILAGSPTLLNIIPVLLRRHSFQMQARLTSCLNKYDPDTPVKTRWARAFSDSIVVKPVQVQSPDSNSDDDAVDVDGKVLHGMMHQQSPRSSARRFREPKGFYSKSLSTGHRLEYKALGQVIRIVLAYWFVVHTIFVFMFLAHFHFSSEPDLQRFRHEGLKSVSHALYMTVSAFQNNGLVMMKDGIIYFRRSPFLLNTLGALVVLGNTGLPIMMRLIAWTLSKTARRGSERERVLNFLLEHPRRCFTHMFPAMHTLWLLLVLTFLIVTQMLVTLWRDWDSLATRGLSSMDKFWNALSLALSTRTAGMNSLDVSLLSQASTFLLVVLMYFSTTPTVVTMRLSTEGELDITGRVEGVEEEVFKGDSLRGQARRYLSQDITYLTVIIFLICVFEQPMFETSDRDTKGIYGEFTFFKVLFEVSSAYGTCGYSLGYHSQAASFSQAWSAPSKFLLVMVMILGRLRGLPDSIDPSVRVAMSTGNTAQRSFLQAA